MGENRQLPIVALFVTSLNEVIDLHESRVTVALYQRLPPVILGVLYFVALLSVGMVGLRSGMDRARSAAPTIALISVIVAVITLIDSLEQDVRYQQARARRYSRADRQGSAGIGDAVRRCMWKAVLACVAASTAPAAAQSVLAGGSCPMIPEGTHVAEVDTPDGGALDFTIGADPAILRARVHMLAEAHNQMPERMTVVGVGSNAHEQPIVQSHATAVDTPTGARLFLSAEDPAQIAQLRRQVRDKVASCRARDMP